MQPCRWDDPQGALSITLDCKVVDGIRVDVIDAFLSLPRRGAEVGGLLLGRIDNASPLRITVEAFVPIPCEHRFGPSYVLSDADRAALQRELAAASPPPVGLYRSYTGRDPALDAADRELVEACFSGPEHALLLIRPVATDKCVASFAWWTGGDVHTSEPFPFDEWDHSPAPVMPLPEAPPPEAPVMPATPPPQQRPTLPPSVRPRRLLGEETAPAHNTRPRFWVPLLACILLSIGAAFAYEWWKLNHAAPNPPAHPQTQTADRAVSPPKTPLPPPQVIPQPQHQAAAPAEPVFPAPEPARKSPIPAVVAVAPIPIHKVQPGISEGIRSRIHGRVVIPVEVRVNRSGRVTSAVAHERGAALQQYLADRAVRAARLWRFQPARSRNGARVPASRTLYFVFSR